VNLKPDEIDWLRRILSAGLAGQSGSSKLMTKTELMKELGLTYMEDFDFDNWPAFSWEIEPEGLWVYSEAGGDPDEVAQVFKAFLRKFRPREMLVVRYAETCSKPRLGEFGGGAYVVMANKIEQISAHGWVDSMQKRYSKFKWVS
jgi:hypothetical protein